MGRNSLSPWMIPRTRAWKTVTTGDGELGTGDWKQERGTLEVLRARGDCEIVERLVLLDDVIDGEARPRIAGGEGAHRLPPISIAQNRRCRGSHPVDVADRAQRA